MWTANSAEIFSPSTRTATGEIAWSELAVNEKSARLARKSTREARESFDILLYSNYLTKEDALQSFRPGIVLEKGPDLKHDSDRKSTRKKPDLQLLPHRLSVLR